MVRAGAWFSLVIALVLVPGAPGTAAVDAGSLWGSGPASPAMQGTLRALTYNVEGLPEAIAGSDRAARAPLISPLLNDYDLVLLQEDWGDPVQEQRPGPAGLLSSAEAVPPLFYHHLVVADAGHRHRTEPAPHPVGTDPRRVGVGPTLIADGLNRLAGQPFAALPLEDAHEPYDNTVDEQVTRVMWRECHGDLAMEVAEEALTSTGAEDELEEQGVIGHHGLVDGGSTDCAAQKGFSVARTRLAPGVEVDVYNLHADAGEHVNDIDARADNFDQLADFIVEHSGDRAVLLGGDTNLKVTSDERAERRERDREVWTDFQERTGLTDVCLLLDCPLEELVEQGSKVHDKFAVRSGGGVELTPAHYAYERDTFSDDQGEPLSDHDPMLLVVDWRADPSTSRPPAGAPSR